MKKLKLSELNLGNAEVLSREELKKVLGGMGSGGGSASNCSCGTKTTIDASCCTSCTTSSGDAGLMACGGTAPGDCKKCE